MPQGSVYGSAHTRETHIKNHEAFTRWSIVLINLVEVEKFSDLSTMVLEQKFQFSIAMAPISVLRIF